jgi:hypothetical protein
MTKRSRQEFLDILARHCGPTCLTDVPPPRLILLQVLHLIGLEQERRGAFAEPISWEDLPDELRGLLQQLKSKQGPTKL